MTPPLFRRSPLPTGDTLVLEGDEGRYAATVRRLQLGEVVDVTDGAGQVATCHVAALGASGQRVELAVDARHDEPVPQPWVVVVQALVKGDRSELAVELCTEVGVDEIVPWAAQRSIARWAGQRTLRRWTAVAEAASRQSRRARWPIVRPAPGPGELTARVRAADLALLLDEQAPVALSGVEVPPRGEVLLVVGPEGGYTEAEHEALVGAGALPVRLGPSVLRASSAGAVGAGVLLSRTRRWSALP